VAVADPPSIQAWTLADVRLPTLRESLGMAPYGVAAAGTPLTVQLPPAQGSGENLAKLLLGR